MSTYWYYECLDHEPPLQSEDEFTQHTDDRHYRRGIDLIAQRPLVVEDRHFSDPLGSDEERADAYFTANAHRFLRFHPTCRIGVINEYGDRPKETP